MTFPYELLVKVISYNDLNELLRWRQVSRCTKLIAEEHFLQKRKHIKPKGPKYLNGPLFWMNKSDIYVMRRLRQPARDLQMLTTLLLVLLPDAEWQRYLVECYYHPSWIAVLSIMQRRSTVRWLECLCMRRTREYIDDKQLFKNEIVMNMSIFRYVCVHLESLDWFTITDGSIGHYIYFALLALCDIWQLGRDINLHKVTHEAQKAIAERRARTVQ